MKSPMAHALWVASAVVIERRQTAIQLPIRPQVQAHDEGKEGYEKQYEHGSLL
jgi:hypothetical protein